MPVAALSLAACLLIMFSTLMIRALKVGYSGGCACFTSATRSARLGSSDILFDAALLVGTLFALGAETLSSAVPVSILDIGYFDVLCIVSMLLWLGATYWMIREVEVTMRRLREDT